MNTIGVIPKEGGKKYTFLYQLVTQVLENIGGCEPTQAAREELWGCDWFSSLKPSVLSRLTGQNHPEK